MAPHFGFPCSSMELTLSMGRFGSEKDPDLGQVTRKKTKFYSYKETDYSNGMKTEVGHLNNSSALWISSKYK